MSADGVFGRDTTRAVTAFQTEHRLAVDGIVGPDTWSALVNIT
ncbi:peptidoglycan-binding protein [Streptomyces gelaticus]